MIRYALECVGEHQFEAWFSNSEAYELQRRNGLIECPECGSRKVQKQIMAPAVSGTKKSTPADQMEVMAARFAGEVRKQIANTHEFVGERFASEARAMHAGEKDARPVWGQVSPEVARELREEGVPAMPLPAPFAPQLPKKTRELN